VLLSALVIRTIGTERLVLSRLAHGDVGELAAMLLNPALYTHIDGAPASPAEAEDRIGRWLRGSPDPDVLWINYVARDRADGGFVGLAQATVRGRTCEIAYLVDPSAQRRGFATEMMGAFCAELRETIEPAEFVAHILAGHVASERVVTALGLAPTADHVEGERVWRG
jgi:RimJ/RimL family protein N-acetyltransferase